MLPLFARHASLGSKRQPLRSRCCRATLVHSKNALMALMIGAADRTYGTSKRRTSVTVRNTSASRGLFGGGNQFAASSASAGLSTMHEEEAAGVVGTDAVRLSPTMESFRREMHFG